MRPSTRFVLAAGLLAILSLLTAAEPGRPAEDGAPKKRTFLFTYAGTVTGLKPGEKARVWLPVPPTNDDQDVKLESQDLPAEPREGETRSTATRCCTSRRPRTRTATCRSPGHTA